MPTLNGIQRVYLNSLHHRQSAAAPSSLPTARNCSKYLLPKVILRKDSGGVITDSGGMNRQVL